MKISHWASVQSPCDVDDSDDNDDYDENNDDDEQLGLGPNAL